MLTVSDTEFYWLSSSSSLSSSLLLELENFQQYILNNSESFISSLHSKSFEPSAFMRVPLSTLENLYKKKLTVNLRIELLEVPKVWKVVDSYWFIRDPV